MTPGLSGSDAGKVASLSSEEADCRHKENFQSFFDNEQGAENQQTDVATPQPRIMPEAAAFRTSNPPDAISKAKPEQPGRDMEGAPTQHDRSSDEPLQNIKKEARFASLDGQETSLISIRPDNLHSQPTPEIDMVEVPLQTNTMRQTEDDKDARLRPHNLETMRYHDGDEAQNTVLQGPVVLPQMMQDYQPQKQEFAGSRSKNTRLQIEAMTQESGRQGSNMPAQQEVTHGSRLSLPAQGLTPNSPPPAGLTTPLQDAHEKISVVTALDKTVPDQTATSGASPKGPPDERVVGNFVPPRATSTPLSMPQPVMKLSEPVRIVSEAGDNLPPSIPEISRPVQAPMQGADKVVLPQMVLPPAPVTPVSGLAEVASLQGQTKAPLMRDLSEGVEWPLGVTQVQSSMSANGAVGMPTINVARQVAHQFLTAASANAQGTVDIQLNPESLGRVRINMTMADGAMIMNIQADRMETLDLMRRNIDQLAQEFRMIGYDNISFSFGQNAKQGQHPEPVSLNEKSEPIDTKIFQPSLPVIGQSLSGLDIRV
ncbi:MAG: flagellar hook-length control protein FliK [Rhodobacterales bacterium]